LKHKDLNFKEGRRLAFPLDVISDDDKDSFQE